MISKSGICVFFHGYSFQVPAASFGECSKEEDILVVILESASLGKEVPGAVWPGAGWQVDVCQR